ncbi:unnamed protein product, partial [Symbiodinium microadriaticum]
SHSSKSLPDPEMEADAKAAGSFLMTSAHNRLAKALSTGGFDGKDPVSAGSKKEKKKRKRGSSSETSRSEHKEEDLISIFNLPQKEFSRQPRQLRLDDLSCKQLAVAVANLTGFTSASDLLATGGEYESLLSASAIRIKKSKQKIGEQAAVEKAAAAGACWRARLCRVVLLLTGKKAPDVNIMNARTLTDVTALLKSLYKSQKRKQDLDEKALAKEYDALVLELKQVKTMMRKVGDLVSDHKCARLDEREKRLDAREEALERREQQLLEREDRFLEREKDLLNKIQEHEQQKQAWQTQWNPRGARMMCSHCGQRPCGRDHDCYSDPYSHHNCRVCHKEWKVTGHKGSGQASGSKGRGRGHY